MTARRLFQAAGWLCVAAIVVLSLVAPSLRPVTVVPHPLEHAAIFAAAGLALGFGYPGRTAHHMAMMIIFAGAIELAQFYAPGRHARLIDFMVDALGSLRGSGSRRRRRAASRELGRKQSRFDQPAEPDTGRQKQTERDFQRGIEHARGCEPANKYVPIDFSA
jgi:hypothetical protein